MSEDYGFLLQRANERARQAETERDAALADLEAAREALRLAVAGLLKIEQDAEQPYSHSKKSALIARSVREAIDPALRAEVGA